jgi:hypothetical protein
MTSTMPFPSTLTASDCSGVQPKKNSWRGMSPKLATPGAMTCGPSTTVTCAVGLDSGTGMLHHVGPAPHVILMCVGDDQRVNIRHFYAQGRHVAQQWGWVLAPRVIAHVEEDSRVIGADEVGDTWLAYQNLP